jgi:hypothetical protein
LDRYAVRDADPHTALASVAEGLVRRPDTAPVHPVQHRNRWRRWERKLAVEARGTLVVELPPPPPQPELIIIKIKGDELRADPASIGVRITFDPPQDALETRADEEEDDE